MRNKFEFKINSISFSGFSAQDKIHSGLAQIDHRYILPEAAPHISLVYYLWNPEINLIVESRQLLPIMLTRWDHFNAVVVSETVAHLFPLI